MLIAGVKFTGEASQWSIREWKRSRWELFNSNLTMFSFNPQNHTDNYFVRNNRYRSTIQASNPALMSSPNRNAPVTPVFRSRYSSQTSVDSTNPFEDDYLETMSTLDSPVRRSARKKRRAPPPPPLSSGSQSVGFVWALHFGVNFNHSNEVIVTN